MKQVYIMENIHKSINKNIFLALGHMVRCAKNLDFFMFLHEFVIFLLAYVRGICIIGKHAGLAQLVERLICNQ